MNVHRAPKMHPGVFLVITLLLVVLNDAIIQALDVFSLLDELITLIIFMAGALSILRREGSVLFAWEKKVILALAVITLAGLIPYLLGRGNEISAVIADMYVFLKFFLMYFGIRLIGLTISLPSWRNWMVKYVLLMATVLLLSLIANKAFQIFPVFDIRYGFNSETLFFGHPSRFSFVCISIFVLGYPYFEQRRWLLFCILAIGFFSLRSKFFIFYVVAVFVSFGLQAWISKRKRIGRRNTSLIFVLLMAAVLFSIPFLVIGLERSQEFFSLDAYDMEYARAVLFYNSIQIASDQFPFGVGFGAFGSWYSAVYYSPTYFEYYMDKVYGLTQTDFSFVADAYWPMVVGQFGAIGGAALLYIFWKFLRGIYELKSCFEDERLLGWVISALILMIALLIDSFADSTLTQSRAVWAALYIGLVVNHAMNQTRNSEIA